MQRKIVMVLLVIGLIFPAVATAKWLTEETGQEILKELREVNKNLKNQRQAPARQKKRAKTGEMVKISSKGSPFLGKANAPITIVEFTDYQCPFCKRFFDTTFAELKKKYIDTGKVKFVSRNLPLGFHKDAPGAAEAVICAGEQGKYWQMREVAFKNMKALKSGNLLQYAGELKLDMQKFKVCVDSDKFMSKIKKDSADARAIGITGTPSFVIGKSSPDIIDGEKIIGAQPFAIFESRIKALLGAKGK
ncbi:MAG: DsbA family protein [Deltaproteobacteria bacterium]|nr:DsbA family protein [Deltaproteobacteria bacterium]